MPFCFYGWVFSPTGFVIDYHLKSRGYFEKRFEEGKFENKQVPRSIIARATLGVRM